MKTKTIFTICILTIIVTCKFSLAALDWDILYYTAGQTYHVTHRCHDRQFLLKFARDRDLYRSMLRERLKPNRVDLYGYCLTSNHVHLLCHTRSQEGLAALMQSLAGEFAQSYNRRKGRGGAFWGDRYHATLIDSGEYLWRCLLYVDMNMVRAGVVEHPGEWAWCGHDELMGLRKRYRLINQEALRESLGGWSEEVFRKRYSEALALILEKKTLAREACWTESLAVGRSAFVEQIAGILRNRKRIEMLTSPNDPELHILREQSATPYVAGKV